MASKIYFKEDIFIMSKNLTQLERLQALQTSSKAQKQASNMIRFDNLVGVYLGTEPTEHFPKLLDSNGNKIQEEQNGRKVDKRSETPDGWTYTFAEFGTCKMIKIVLPQKVEVKLMSAYTLSGMGYDIKSGNMFFIEKESEIKNY